MATTIDNPCVALVQWGGFCQMPPDMRDYLQKWASIRRGEYKELLRTTPPPTSIANVDQQTLQEVEKLALKVIGGYNPQNTTFYNQATLEKERQTYEEEQLLDLPNRTNLAAQIDYLLSVAIGAASNGPWSVMDKPDCEILPSCHYYYSRSPYYWPAPDTPDGYEKRDGHRVPGSSTHDSESHKYDRTRWYDLYGNTTILALAWFFSRNETYAEIGARNIRTWFLDPNTRMEPTLLYGRKFRRR